MNVLFALVADRARVEASGKLAVSGVFELIRATRFPAVHARMFLVIRLDVPATDLGVATNLRIPLNGPGDQQILLVDGSIQINLPEHLRRGRESIIHDQVIELNDVSFPEPGEYRFSVEVQGESKASVPICVILEKEDYERESAALAG